MGKTVAAWLFFSSILFFLFFVLVFSLLSRFEFLFLRMKFLFNWDIAFPLFLFHPFLETKILSKSLISRTFLKPNRLRFQKNAWKIIDSSQKALVGKMHKLIKQLLPLFTWNQKFLKLNEMSENCNVNAP